MKPPNLLFLMTDQQRADTLDPHGACLTPHLDALAAGGTRFERCYAPNPICSPTRASLFTGLLPHAHGVTDVTHAVEPSQADLVPGLPFWTRDLADAGYRTGYFGKWHVERSDELERFGIDEYEVDLRLTGVPDLDDALERAVVLRNEGYDDFLVCGVSDVPVSETREAYLFGRGIEFLHAAAREPDRPWALFVSTEAPHDPYLAPREAFERYDPDALELPASFSDDLTDRPEVYRRIQRSWGALEPDDYRTATACYYALCSVVDEQVGRVLATLDDLDLTRDTIVVFTSDHGDYLGAHRLMLKGVPAFEEAYRVPLVLRGPGIPSGRTVPAPVSLLDLPRTLVRLLIGEDFGGHGRDLGRHLAGDVDRSEGEAFAEFHGQRLRYTQRVLWRGRWKYVFNGFDVDELYDLEADPYELRNLAADPANAEVLAAMTARMWRVVRETGDRTLGDAQYGMFRFFPVGPNAGRPPTEEE